MTKFGKFLKNTYMASFWKDGDGISWHWNYWNPLTLLLIPFIVIIIIFFFGINELLEDHYSYGFGYSKYWKARLDKREFI